MTNPTLNLQRIYAKNSSFELKDAPQFFKEQKPMENSIEMRINHTPLADNHHEVILSLNVTAKIEDKIVFTGKVEQAGLFKIEDVTDEQLQQITNIHCPHLLYPYACNLLTQLAVSASFSSMVLQPVNFADLYQQRKKLESEQAETK
jgi:preprotein translocase subunit SecB